MVAVGTGVAVVVVDVTVTTSVGVHSDRRVKCQGILAVFVHQPVGVNHRDQKDLRTVDLNEEGARVRLFCFWLHNDGSRNLNEEFTGLDMANLEVFLRGEELLAEHGLAVVEGVASRHAEAFAQTKPLCSVWKNRGLSQDEVLLDLVGLNRVVKVKALCKWVTDDVTANFNAVGGGRCDVGLRSGTGLIECDEHRVQS